MRILLVLVVLVLLIGAVATWLPERAGHPIGPTAADATSPPPLAAHALTTRSNPRGGLLTAVDRAIAGARHQVLVLGSLRGAERIAAALVSAHARGVEVQVVAPAEADGPDQVLRSLPQAGVLVAIDAEHHGMSTCLVVIDGAGAILAGTLADAGEHDDAGMAWLAEDPDLAGDCITTWRTHRAHAQLLQVPGAPYSEPMEPPAATSAPPADASPSRVEPVPAPDDSSPFHTTHRNIDH